MLNILCIGNTDWLMRMVKVYLEAGENVRLIPSETLAESEPGGLKYERIIIDEACYFDVFMEDIIKGEKNETRNRVSD